MNNDMMDFYDTITYYYDVVCNRGLKRKFNEKKGVRLLNKLDEWELYYEEKLDLMGA